jgi:hypothetical protein
VRRDVPELRAAGRAAESARFVPLDRLADPAAVVLDEDLEDPAAGGDRPLDRAGSSPGDRLVSPYRKLRAES